MKIQFNTDKNIDGNERNEAYFSNLISESLDKYSDQITRVEVHLSDLNSDKKGQKDKRCVLEVRFEGRQPLVVTNEADTIEQAVSGSLDKLINAQETIIGKLKSY